MVSRDDVPTPDDAADELYALLPQEFTVRRDEFVAAAKAHGDRAAANEIAGFRKPSTGAWLANRLVRERADDVRSLLDLGASLREAQSQLRGDQLRELARQRRQAVNALVREARHSAAAAGLPVGDDIARQLEQTLEAAVSSDEAAQRLASGRLVSMLTPTAEFGSFPPQLHVVRETEEGSGRRKADAAARNQQSQRDKQSGPTEPAAANGPKKKAELAKARQAVKAAEGIATGARRELADRGSQIDKIVAGINEHESAVADLQAEIEELSERLRHTKERLTELRRAHQEARRALTTAERETRAADRRVEAARAELEELE
ncbi:MAG: hypothetical protein ACRDV3_01020 [Acidothermaceae bacterium]